MNAAEILDRLEKFASLLELNDANPFKIRAYTNGIRALENAETGLEDLILNNQLTQLKGIGKGLAAHIMALYQDQPDSEYEDLMNATPHGLLDMLRIQGLGTKKVKAIYETLGISSIGELEYACHENRLASMKGFGEKSQANVLKSIEFLKQHQGMFLYPFAFEKAQSLITAIQEREQVESAELTGDLRRGLEVVAEIQILVKASPEHHVAILQSLGEIESVSQIESIQDNSCWLSLKSGIPAQVILVNPVSFIPAWVYHTGSHLHVSHLQTVAQSKGFNFTSSAFSKPDQVHNLQSEAVLYQALDLPFIPAERREHTDEFETLLPAENLIQKSDIKGLFHAHTLWSDGDASVAQMADYCRQMGMQYLGITEHSQSAVYAHGLEVERVKTQWQEIDQLNQIDSDFKIFKGIEVDILADGSLDYDDELLKGFDFVIASVHSRFNMSREDMTARILKAAQHPAVTMLGHLTGRILLAREGYPLDIEAIIDACVEHNTVIEVNAHPSRLDLDWRWGVYARQKGLKVSINPDAHSVSGLELYHHGVITARKAGFAKHDVVNTLNLQEISDWLSSKNI